MELKNILVTGSSGYIGSVLSEKLTDQGFFVSGIDTLFYKNSLFNSLNNFPFRKVDIRNISVNDLFGFDALIHLAALSNDSLGSLNKELTEEINYKETINLAKKAKKAGIKRFIFSSSCSVYGIAKNKIVDERSRVNPLTTYAKSKTMSEEKLRKLADKNFTVALLRNSTVYGFSNAFRDDLVVNNLVASGLAIGKIIMKSDGTPWRPLIDVRDLSDIFIQFLMIPSRKVNGKIYNIGFNQNNFQIKEVLKIVSRRLNCKIVFSNEHGPDTRSYQVDFSNFKKLSPATKLNWDLEKSINDLVINLRKYKYNKYQFNSGKFARQAQIQRLLKNKKLTDRLFWISK